MNIKGNLHRIIELCIGFTSVAILALTGCGGGGGSAPATVTVSTFAGTSGASGVVDATGVNARFETPTYLVSDGASFVYVTDYTANNIRRIDITTGAVTTFAGSTTGVSGVANTATGTAALFNGPWGITTDGTYLYVADSGNYVIRRIKISTQEVTTLAGTGSQGSTNATPGTSASFGQPYGICRIGTSLYVTDSVNSTIRKIDLSASNAVSTLAGSTGNYGYTNSTTGASAVFYAPTDITTDGTSFVYVADTDNNDVRKIDVVTGATTLVAGGNSLLSGYGVGSTDAIGMSARFNVPMGITTDGTNLYVTDTYNHTIRKIVIATGFTSTPAGAVLTPGNADGAGPSARFRYPTGIIYVNGDLYVADFTNSSIRKIKL